MAIVACCIFAVLLGRCVFGFWVCTDSGGGVVFCGGVRFLWGISPSCGGYVSRRRFVLFFAVSQFLRLRPGSRTDLLLRTAEAPILLRNNFLFQILRSSPSLLLSTSLLSLLLDYLRGYRIGAKLQSHLSILPVSIR